MMILPYNLSCKVWKMKLFFCTAPLCLEAGRNSLNLRLAGEKNEHTEGLTIFNQFKISGE